MIITEEEARAEAVRRWGAEAYIRDRQESYPLVPRFVVGTKRIGHQSATVHGEGETWQAAFDEASSRDVFLKGF